MVRTLPLLLPLVACALDKAEADRATVCLQEDLLGSDEVAAPNITADSPLTLFAMDTAGCHTEELAVTCTAEVVDDAIFVSTETTWVRTEPLAMSCESVLFTTATSCATEGDLAPGTYTLLYAGQEMTIEVPSTPEPACIVPS